MHAPGPGEVQLSIHAIGLNRSEAMFRAGRHVEQAIFPARLGYEAAGVVSALGPGVTGLRIGERVCLVPPPSVTQWGTYADSLNVPVQYVVPIAPTTSSVEAAGTWMAAITAYGALIDLGGLRCGDFVLVLAASSSVGLACLQIARYMGARAIATTRRESKVAVLREAGAAQVIVNEGAALAERILEATGGEGVRLVLDPIGGPGFTEMPLVLSQHGLIVVYGELDNRAAPFFPLDIIGKGLMIRGFTFKEIVLDDVRRAKAVSYIQQAIAAEKLVPVIDRVFTFDHIADAHRFLEENTHVGKVVVTV